MSNEQLNRNYNMSDSELTMFAQHVIDSMNNDIVHFAPFAVLPETVTSFQTLCDDFEVFPTDTYMSIQQQLATENKDELLDEVRRLIKTMALRAEFAWGKNSPKYKNLGISDMTQITDEAFVTRARLIYSCINDFKTELAPQGVTDEVLVDMEAKIQELEDAKRQQIEKVSVREEKTIERIENGNQLYKLIKHYCNIGKGIWDGVNPAKYNDYIIYDTYYPTSLTAPENLSVDVGTMTFSVTPVPNAVTYQFEMAVAGSSEFEVIYSGPDNFFIYTPPASGLRTYRARCHSSSGYSEYSSLMVYNYVSVLAQSGYVSVSIINANTGAVALNWEEVASAEFYRLFHSQTALNAPDPGEYTMLGEFTVGSYSGIVNTGYRHWFQVFAGNSELLSTASDSVMVDMPLVP